MTQQTSPFLGVNYGWAYGESNWNEGMDNNLLKFSFLFDRNIDGIVATLPAAVSGKAYFLTTDNMLYFAIGSTYYFSPTPKWFTLYIRGTGLSYQFDGTNLNVLSSVSDLNTRLTAAELKLSGLGTASTKDIGFFASATQLSTAITQANTYTDTSAATKVNKAGDTLTGALNYAPAVTLADSATPAIGAAASNTVILNGSTAITGFDTIAAGTRRNVRFNTARTLTYDSTKFILPTRANIYTAIGDRAEFISLGSGNWECINYFRISGYSVANITSKDIGAVGTGLVSDVAALAQANTLGVASITIVGNCLIDSNLTINCPVVMTENSRFTINTGVTLTLSSNFTAPLSQVFNCIGTGSVVTNKAKVKVGYPEWWGAVANSGADCTAALNACILACPTTELQAADYSVATTLQINTAGRTINGAGAQYYSAAGQGTRIVSLSGSTNIINIGPSTQPASINDFPQGIILNNLLATRAVAPVISSACVGIFSRWTLYQQLNNVKSAESIYGFQNVGTVQCRTNNCQAFRSIAGTGTGTDTFRGFFVDGTTVLTGVAGGNASVHWFKCVASCVLSSFTSYGIYVNGSWADTFIDNFESTATSVGIYLQGDTTSTLNYRTVDMHIINPIIDQFTFAGIFIDGTSAFATISIQGGYAAPVASGTPNACIYINNSFGAVNISGGFQHICGPNTTMTAGLLIIGSSNVDSIGNIVSEVSTNGIILSNSSFCKIEDRIQNASRTATAAISLQATSTRNNLRPMINGKASAFTTGIQLQGTATTSNGIDATGVGTGAVSGARVSVNGTAVTTVGLTGTNYIYGVVA